jgi:hypothetical protein
LLIPYSVLALNLGRPTAVPDIFNVSAPSDLDDEYITEQGYAQPPTQARSKTAFFVQLVTFCDILKDVHRSLYSESLSRNTSGNRSRILVTPAFHEAVRLDKSLVEWYQAVPNFLKFSELDEDDNFKWIRNVILAR